MGCIAWRYSRAYRTTVALWPTGVGVCYRHTIRLCIIERPRLPERNDSGRLLTPLRKPATWVSRVKPCYAQTPHGRWRKPHAESDVFTRTLPQHLYTPLVRRTPSTYTVSPPPHKTSSFPLLRDQTRSIPGPYRRANEQ